MVLLYFMQNEMKQGTRDNTLSYEQLYAAIPLSESTIRGIIQEFLHVRLIQKVFTQDTAGWKLTAMGRVQGRELFEPLWNSESQQKVTLVVFPSYASSVRVKAQKIVARMGSIAVDAHSFFVLNQIDRELQKKLLALSLHPALFVPVDATQKGFQSFLFQTREGKKCYAQREKIAGLTQKYRGSLRRYSSTSHTLKKIKGILLADIISALRDSDTIPEEYYPREMRLSTFVDSFW